MAIDTQQRIWFCGDNTFHQRGILSWSNTVIVKLSAGDYHTAGLTQDGHVLTCGYDGYGQCNTKKWHDIIDITTGEGYTVGLKSDGTVVATGINNYGQCDVQNWKNVVAIAAGGCQTFGIRSDGAVLFTGNEYGEGVSRWHLK